MFGAEHAAPFHAIGGVSTLAFRLAEVRRIGRLLSFVDSDILRRQARFSEFR